MENINIIIKLAMGENITDSEIESELYDICENVHSSCNDDCPVYYLNGSSIPDTAHDFNVNRGCDCFKNGHVMLQFIRKMQTNKP